MGSLDRILHVDDNEDIRIITRLTLESVGNFQVIQFESGAAAIEGAAEFKPQIFLLDVMMPDMNGEETWRALLRIPGLENIPAVFLTAKAEKEYLTHLLDAGAMAVITKPFEPFALCSELEDAWRRSQA